jgi:phage terminase large subunit
MRLYPKQSHTLELLEDPDGPTEVLMGGAAGGGKSAMLVYWLLKGAVKYPGSRWLLGRHELTRLKESTLVTFFEIAEMQGFHVGKQYIYNQQGNFLLFKNGSKILLRDLAYLPSDPEYHRFGSLEITGAAIDEAAEVREGVKEILSIRVGRWKNKQFGVPGKILMSCNPHKGWLYHTFYKPWRDGCLESHRAFIPAVSGDNPALDDAYLLSLNRLTGARRERMLLGNWDYDEDPARLMDFENIANLWTNTFVPEGKEKFITADIAMMGSDKYVLKVWAGWRVIGISVFPKIDAKAIENHIREKANEFSVPRSNIVYDADGLGSYLNSYLEGAHGFNNNGKPVVREAGTDPFQENFTNLKTQCSYKLAEKVQAAQIYIVDREYRDEISAELAWIKRDRMDSDGKLYLLPKEKVKLGLGRSPDFADSMMMRTYFEITRERNKKITGSATNDDILGHGGRYADDDYGITKGY